METTATASDVVPASVADGRDLVRNRCLEAGTPAGTTAVAVLLTSELVTNALVHAASACRLQVTATASFVHVEVEDESTEVPRVLHGAGGLTGRSAPATRERCDPPAGRLLAGCWPAADWLLTGWASGARHPRVRLRS